MTLADKVTSLRLVLIPFFFILYLVPEIYFPALKDQLWVIVALWALFIAIECTDWLDGKIARSRNETSDFGKLYDPFADTLVRMGYFLCFVFTRILPIIPLLLILYREFGILFLRILMMKKGIAMGARKGGKLKAVCYMLTGLACLLSVTMERLGFSDPVSFFRQTATVIFILSMVMAVVSFIDYFIVYLKTSKSIT